MRFVILLPALLALAQEPAIFDVASVKPTSYVRPASGPSSSYVKVVSPGRLVASNASLGECIQFAWGLQDHQLIAPDWALSNGFNLDIEAKASPLVPESGLRLMLQNLLRERMKLVVHEESRQFPIFRLTVAKGGLTLKPAADDASPRFSNSSTFSTHIVSEKATLSRLAAALGRRLGKPVLDGTGVAGDFAMDIEWDNDDTGAAAVVALRKVGLKLESGKGPFNVVIVDSADRVPSAN